MGPAAHAVSLRTALYVEVRVDLMSGTSCCVCAKAGNTTIPEKRKNNPLRYKDT